MEVRQRADPGYGATVTSGQDLTIAERLRLAQAACHEVARAAGVDLLFVKGTVAADQFPTRSKVGSDVDALVRPEQVERYVEALQRAGWVLMRRSSGLDLSNHAIVLEHPVFACTVDVHRFFPGFEAPPEVVFERLWAHRGQVTSAGHDVPVPSVVHHGLLLIVNAARSAGSSEARTIWNAWGSAEHEQAKVAVDLLGAQAAAATQLPDVFGASDSRYWQVVADNPTGVSMWLARLADTRGLAPRLRLVGHALVPPPRWGEQDRCLGRLLRVPGHWAKGARQLPAAVRRLRSMRGR